MPTRPVSEGTRQVTVSSGGQYMADHLPNPKQGRAPTNTKRQKARNGERAGVNDDHGSAAENATEASIIPVIGIGASAGGIEALSRFLQAMPPDSGAALVIVLHLDPHRESQLAHVLAATPPCRLCRLRTERGLPVTTST
jgi:chemotaxis response regulator CheB